MKKSYWKYLLVIIFLPACGVANHTPDLGGLYNDLAQREDPHRNPIIVIPGLLGSKLVDKQSDTIVWGAFGLGQVDPNDSEGAQLVALPMKSGKKFSELKDGVMSDGALDRVVFNFLGFPLKLNAYYRILQTLGVGGYRDQTLGEAGAIDYGSNHFTCFQFDYDWRRDIVEAAQDLDRFIKEKTKYVKRMSEQQFGFEREEVKFDIVAHSMGGLVARYYAMYGGADLPEDGSLPEVTWAGARHVENLVIIGTPNAGSLDSLRKLIKGGQPGRFLPNYPAAVLGTWPSMYELLPRPRHKPLVDQQDRSVDLYNPNLWKKNEWGLANPEQDKVLQSLLPDIQNSEDRRQIALEYQRKALARAKQFSSAMDVVVEPPEKLKLMLVAGDAEQTIKSFKYNSKGEIDIHARGPGDGTVLRSSALLDEREGMSPMLMHLSPIKWSQVLFLFSDHLGLTKEPAFTDNILYFLLESPRL
ncbi:MAG: esterase/lipase family protein [Nitrospinales bacterium]